MTAKHGTEWGYDSGCRCPQCEKAGDPLGATDPSDLLHSHTPSSRDGSVAPSERKAA